MSNFLGRFHLNVENHLLLLWFGSDHLKNLAQLSIKPVELACVASVSVGFPWGFRADFDVLVSLFSLFSVSP